jgi:hypothetical protein
MPITTYTAGEVLTAASLNANFAAGGLQLIKTQTIGSAVSSVAVTGAFSATYDSYKILVTGGVGSTDASIQVQLGATTTGYYGGWGGAVFSTGVSDAGSYSNQTAFTNAGRTSANTSYMNIELQNPFLTKNTFAQYTWVVNSTTGRSRQTGAYLNDSTSYTGFTLIAESGTFTGGTIRVYGYVNS